MSESEKRRGRPRRDHPPRRKMSLLIDEDIAEWLVANLRRDVYVSDIVNDALRKFAQIPPHRPRAAR